MIDKIKKHYKNTEMLLDIYIKNYHDVNIYIRLDYYKKENCYKLSWLDLAHIKGNNIPNVISYEYIPEGVIKHIEKLIIDINLDNYKNEEVEKNLVIVNSEFKYNKFRLSFDRYIPRELNQLFNLFVVIFDNLPRKLNPFLQEMGAKIIGNQSKYEYEEAFKFDLFNDDIDKVFDKEVSQKGNDYYEENRVLFLEKVGDKYFGVVGGKSLYVVIINYNEKEKETNVYCSCPCEFKCKHIYAVILALRNNNFHKFYKITHKNNDMPMLDRIMNFNFLLTIGIDDQNNNYLIIEDGLLKLLPVINSQGKSEWIIIEDDDKNTLSKRLESIIGKK